MGGNIKIDFKESSAKAWTGYISLGTEECNPVW